MLFSLCLLLVCFVCVVSVYCCLSALVSLFVFDCLVLMCMDFD